MSFVPAVRPSSNTNESTWRKIKYSSRSVTPESCPPTITAGQQPRSDFWHPTRHPMVACSGTVAAAARPMIATLRHRLIASPPASYITRAR
jgi:hypothetical protein